MTPGGWCGPARGRSAETLDGFFDRLGPSGCEGGQGAQRDALLPAETPRASEARREAAPGDAAPTESCSRPRLSVEGVILQATPDEAPDLLDEWLAGAARSRLGPIVKLARTVRKHAAGILSYLDTKMTKGPVEGIYNKLRVIARRAYGFRSYGALISMLFLCCVGIELAPPLPTAI